MITQENTGNYWRSASSGRPCSPYPLPLYTHTHTVATQGHSLSVWQVYCHARRSEAAEIGNQRRVHQAIAKQERQGKEGKGEKGRGTSGGVLAAIDAEKFTFLAHCDCAWDTVKCLHCSACLERGVSNTSAEGGGGWDLLRLVICILPSQDIGMWCRQDMPANDT